MSCGVGCSGSPSRFSPEYTRQWKPENNSGCGCSGQRNSCSTPSLARKGSALWEWEQIYGKVITTVSFVQNEQGHTVQVVEKTICPKTTKSKSRHGCCSISYRISQ